MPGRLFHNAFALSILKAMKGQITEKDAKFVDLANKYIDMPHLVLEKRHRILFHNVDGLVLTYLIAKKMGVSFRDALAVFLAHVALDKMDSMMKRRKYRRPRGNR